MRSRTTTIAAGTAGAIAIACVTSWMPVEAQGTAAQQPGTAVTVIGCLQRPQSAGSTAGTPTGAPAAPNQSDYRANSSVPDPGYILAGALAKAGTGASAKADAPTGTSGTRGESAQPMTYALVGEESSLAPHVGHTVEVSGVVAPPVSAKAPTNTPDPPAATTPASPTDAAARAFRTGVRQLRVASIRMTANNCDQRP